MGYFAKRAEIKRCKKEIEELEGKLARSQAEFIQATINGREPDPEDLAFHKKYLDRIEELRNTIRSLEG